MVVLRERLGKATLREGDVLLLQGPQDAPSEACGTMTDRFSSSSRTIMPTVSAKGWRFLLAVW